LKADRLRSVRIQSHNGFCQKLSSDKLILSFDVFCREKPKSEGFNHLCYPDFAGMMRPGHDQSTPFGLAAVPRVRILTQRRKDAEAQGTFFGVRREAKRHDALEALFAVEKRCRRCALPPQSKIHAMRDDSDLLQRKMGHGCEFTC
jgi:hypothetical protein